MKSGENMGEHADIKDRIRQLRLAKGWSQQELASKLNVTNVAVSQWERGVKQPKMEMREALCDLFNVNMEYLNGNWDKISRLLSEEEAILLDSRREQNSRLGNQTFARVPVLGYVAAGIPIEEIEDIVDYEEIPAELLRGGKKYFGLVLRGDSMEPRMYDGDVVIVQKQDDAESGEYVIAAVNGDHATCKRLMKYRDSIALVSLNSKYDPMIFTNEEVQEKPVTILGVVREIRGKMKGM